MIKEIKSPLGTKEEIADVLNKGYEVTTILTLLGIKLKSKYDSIKNVYTFVLLPSEYKKLVQLNKSYQMFELFNKVFGFKKVAVMARLKKIDSSEDYFEDSEVKLESKPEIKSFWRRLWKR